MKSSSQTLADRYGKATTSELRKLAEADEALENELEGDQRKSDGADSVEPDAAKKDHEQVRLKMSA